MSNQFVSVGKVPGSSLSAGFQPALAGAAGEMAVTELHGNAYKAAYDGRLFIASTAAAGVTIPVSSATAATFVLYNPIGSNVNAELVMLNIGITNATTVVSPLLLGYASGLIVAPTSVTARTINPALLGSNAAAQCQFYTTATIVAVTTFFTVGSVAAAAGALPNFNLSLQGGIVLSPGSLVHVCGTAAQTSASTISLLYAEWPV